MMTTRPRFVADMMTIDPIVVRVDDTIEQAESALRAYGITGLPVLDDSGRLVGVLSQTDLLWRGDLPISGLLRRRPSGLRVGELMSTPAITVGLDATLGEAARTMRERHVHRLVAVDDAGRPIGVLSATDYLDLFVDEA
jgi:predicted transcriptional regulator